MKLTNEQMEFLDKVCYGRESWDLSSDGLVDVYGNVQMRDMNLTEIPVKFGRVDGWFSCSSNNLTSLNNLPKYIEDGLYIEDNPLHNYFKSIKEEDFPHWDKIYWFEVLKEYPFLINIFKKHSDRTRLKNCLRFYPFLKIYLE